MNILPDPFLSIQDNTSHILSLPLKVKSDLPLAEEGTSNPGLKKINQIEEIDEQDRAQDKEESVDNVVRIAGIIGKKLIVLPLEGITAEEAEQALAENKLGRMEKSEDNLPVFKFPKQQTKNLESLGITSVDLHSSNGVQTYTSFNFQALSDQELSLLITHVKVYIVYLKTKGDINDPKVKRTIDHLEIKLQYLEIENAIRTDNPKLKDLLEELVKTNPCNITWRILSLLAQQKFARKKREKKDDQKLWEIRLLITSKEVIKVIVYNNIISKEINDNNKNSHDIINESRKQNLNSKNINNVGQYINMLKEFYNI